MSDESVFLSVSTYEGLQEQGEPLAWFTEETHERIFSKLPLSPYRTILYGKPIGGIRNREFVFNTRNWARFRQELADGKLQLFTLVARFERPADRRIGRREARVSMTTWPERPDYASVLLLGVHRSLYGDLPSAEWQESWVELACEAFVRLKGANGYLIVDPVSAAPGATISPYEGMIGSSLDFYREFRSKLRGYYWGNLLSQEHIAHLGGMEAIAREAPCYLVRDLSEGRGERAYLQLTPDIDAFPPDDDLRALRDYLRDLLPVGRHVPRWREGIVRYRMVYEE